MGWNRPWVRRQANNTVKRMPLGGQAPSLRWYNNRFMYRLQFSPDCLLLTLPPPTGNIRLRYSHEKGIERKTNVYTRYRKRGLKWLAVHSHWTDCTPVRERDWRGKLVVRVCQPRDRQGYIKYASQFNITTICSHT